MVSASERAGNDLSGDIPNFFQVQQEFGHPTMRLDNLVIEEQLLDGNWTSSPDESSRPTTSPSPR